MPKSNRRRLLFLTGSVLTAGLAGCSSGDDESDSSPTATDGDAGTPTPGGETPTLQVPDGDATVTFALGGGAPDFETLTIDFDRIVFRGDSGTDDATVQFADSGLDLTALSDEGKTYFEDEPFPSGNYTSADCFLTVQAATLSDGGGEATFSGDSPDTVDLVLFDDPLEIPSNGTKDIIISLTANLSFNEEEFSFSTGFSSVG